MSFKSNFMIEILNKKRLDLVLFLKNSNYYKIMSEINFYTLLLFVFTIPFNKNLFTSFIGLWTLTWLLEGNFKQRFKNNILNKQQIIIFCSFLLFYLIHIFSAILSSNKSDAFSNLEVKFSMFLFPILLFVFTNKKKERMQLIFKVFVLSLTISSIVCLIVATSKSLHLDGGKLIFTTAISKYYNELGFFELIKIRKSKFSYATLSIWHHVSYYSMFLNLGIVICYNFYKRYSGKRKILYMTLLFFLSIMIYLLSSRAGLFALTTTFIIIIIIEIRENRYKYKLLFISGLIFMNFCFFINSKLFDTFNKLTHIEKKQEIAQNNAKNNIKEIQYSQNEIKYILKKEEQETKSSDFFTYDFIIQKNIKNDSILEKIKCKYNYKDSRLIIWRNALDVIKKNVLWGVGIGDTKDALVKNYYKIRYIKGIDKKFNAHNQYLESFVGVGIFVFLLIFFIFGYSFYYSFNKNNFMMFVFIIIVFLNFLFESMLETMDGVIFTTLFWLLLSFENNSLISIPWKKTNNN